MILFSFDRVVSFENRRYGWSGGLSTMPTLDIHHSRGRDDSSTRRGETGDADINGFYPSQKTTHHIKAPPDAGTTSKHINSFQTLLTMK